MNRSHHGVAAAAFLVLCLQAGSVTEAATCMEELDRFERRLLDSTLASEDPDAFQSLVRQVEEAAELRDEEQCLQAVAELDAELPQDADVQPLSRESKQVDEDARKNPRRPKAPVLMIAGSRVSKAGNPSASDREDEDADRKSDASAEEGEHHQD
jgi:anion-transporting  ArsA/GET3 family ATPase